MELHQLRYFCAVADSGSFSRAAEKCHVSQPSLSQQILKLESELGARLFDRLGRSVRLTEIGKRFLPRARAVLRELEAARGDVVESKDSVSGHVTIGVIPTVAPYFLPPILTAFSKRFAESSVSVIEEITPVLLERLRGGSVDIAVLALPVRGHDRRRRQRFRESSAHREAIKMVPFANSGERWRCGGKEDVCEEERRIAAP